MAKLEQIAHTPPFLMIYLHNSKKWLSFLENKMIFFIFGLLAKVMDVEYAWSVRSYSRRGGDRVKEVRGLLNYYFSPLQVQLY